VGRKIAFIGFGEAGLAFAIAGARGFDVRQDSTKREDFERHGVTACASSAEAVSGAQIVLSLVTADEALAAATSAAPHLAPNALWLDLNSVAPQTKRAAAARIEAAGAHYVDVAVMAPVLPKRFEAPLLLAGPHAEAATEALSAIGFTSIQTVGGPVGSAASVKMIRSVMIKGIEALSAECALAANAAGVLPQVIASLNSGGAPADWAERLDYNLDRMMVHGTRRSVEMVEVVATLDLLGTGSAMSSACAIRQAEIGSLGLASPQGLNAKLVLLKSAHAQEQAA
jgi:3-hydroxyisobutyrate dehydrogenase-like beta-hydroxyacid dehydrogenase